MNSTAADPLPSWNDGPAKQAVLAFVARVTREGSPYFLPVAERVAVLDNDGTLWPEHPITFQAAFAIDEVKRRIRGRAHARVGSHGASRPGRRPRQVARRRTPRRRDAGPGPHACRDDYDEFSAAVEAWLASARHPRYGRRYDELTYQPMQELLRLLRASGFKNFIVSGGGADFMRVWVERVYGIPPEQVVGSTARTTFEFRDSGPVLTQTLHHLFVNDKQGKPVGIHQFIGGDRWSVAGTATATTLCCSTPRSTTRAPASASSFTTPTVNASTRMTPCEEYGEARRSPRGGARA